MKEALEKFVVRAVWLLRVRLKEKQFLRCSGRDGKKYILAVFSRCTIGVFIPNKKPESICGEKLVSFCHTPSSSLKGSLPTYDKKL